MHLLTLKIDTWCEKSPYWHCYIHTSLDPFVGHPSTHGEGISGLVDARDMRSLAVLALRPLYAAYNLPRLVVQYHYSLWSMTQTFLRRQATQGLAARLCTRPDMSALQPSLSGIECGNRQLNEWG